MIEALVLALPDFTIEFTIETDASGTGLRAVLQQGGHLIAYLSKSLAPRHWSLSIYEKELMAVVLALDKWRGISTPFQTKWLPKLLGFDFEIAYKKGSDNTSTDALSRVSHNAEFHTMLLSEIDTNLMTKVQASWDKDMDLQQLIQKLITKPDTSKKYTWKDVELKRKGKLVVGSDVALRTQLMTVFHCEPVVGYSGVQASLKKLASLFYWKKMSKDVKSFVKKCDICQRNKPNLEAYPGALQPLSIPTRVCLVDLVDRTLVAREEAIGLLKFYLKRAQDIMKSQADKHRTYKEFKVGVWVYLKLQPYRQLTVRQGIQHKLLAKFYGPFQIVSRLRKVAYKLQLPDHVKVHLVFHISHLKKCRSEAVNMGTFPFFNDNGLLVMEPQAVLDRRMQKKNNKAMVYLLIQWVNGTEDDATWEPAEEFIKRFPKFSLDT
ncbi:putative mitochondrial protein [Tanacetum coccineum]